MSYFGHHFASNSDIKKIVARHEGRSNPDNIESIYEMGTETHSEVLERHKRRNGVITSGQDEVVRAMADRFWADKMCRDLVMMPGFRREHEYYRINRFGLEGVRCKCDGEVPELETILELKGLSVTTEKAFRESILHMDYDQGGAWYLDTTTGHIKFKQILIVGLSKKNPDLLFKMLIDRNHPYYKSGVQKIKKGVTIWKQFGFK